MENLTKESQDFLTAKNTEIIRVWDAGMYSNVNVELTNGMIGKGYYPAWKPLKLILGSFK